MTFQGLLTQARPSRRTLRIRLLSYMLMPAALLLVVAVMAILFFSGTADPKQDISRMLRYRLESFRSDVDSLSISLNVMSGQLAGRIADKIDSEISALPGGFSSVAGDMDRITTLEKELIEPLSSHVRQSACSGGYIILNTSLLPETGQTRSGLYIRRDMPSRLAGELLLYRGIASVGADAGIFPHRKWSREINLEQIDASIHQFFEAAESRSDTRCRLSGIFTLPDTSEQVLLSLIPIIGADGTFYGICGLEISRRWFELHFEQPAGEVRIACLLTEDVADSASPMLNVPAGLLAGAQDSYCYLPEECLSTSSNSHHMLTIHGSKEAFVGVSCEVNFPGDGSAYRLAVMMPQSDYRSELTEAYLRIGIVCLLLLFFAGSSCLFLSKRFITPVLRDIERIKQGRVSSPEAATPEFRDVFRHLEERELSYEQAIAALEQKALNEEIKAKSLLEQEAALHNQILALQKQHSATQAEIERLVYHRKSEIDPAHLEAFRAGLSGLSPKERELYQVYLAGCSIKEAAQALQIAESTVYYYNKNIYRLLGVHSVKELRRYAALVDK